MCKSGFICHVLRHLTPPISSDDERVPNLDGLGVGQCDVEPWNREERKYGKCIVSKWN